MHRSLAVVLFFAATAAVVWWMLGDPTATDARPPGIGAPDERATAASAQLAGGAANPAVEASGTAALDRAAVAAATAAAEDAHAPLQLSGVVVDADGAPIAGARVVAQPQLRFDGLVEMADGDAAERYARQLRQRRREATTGPQGEFQLTASGDVAQNLLVYARGYVVLHETTAKPHGPQLDVGLLTVQRGAVVRGRVLDSHGQAVAEARVQRHRKGRSGFMPDLVFAGNRGEPWQREVNRDGVTDAEGRFELVHCAAGAFVLTARHPAHPIARLTDLEVAAGATLEGLLLVVDPGASIRGRVTGLPADAEDIWVLARAAQAPRQSATNEGGGFMLAFGGDEAVFGTDGFAFGNRTTEVDDDGGFVLDGLAAGVTHRVWAVQTGAGMMRFRACTTPVEVATGAQAVELRYDPGVGVELHVVDARSGAPIERLWVHHRLRGAGGMHDMLGMAPRPKATDHPGGRVAMAGLRPKPKQTLSLQIDAIGYRRFEREKIALPASGTLDLGVVRLEPTPILRVQAMAADGTPVAGARVRIRKVEDDRRSRQFSFNVSFSAAAFGGGGGGGAGVATTDAQGWCLVNGFPGEPAVVEVDSQEHAPYASEPFTQPLREDGEHRARLQRGGTVEVVVRNADGSPAADVRVRHRSPADERGREKSDTRGIARFERLVPGPHRFRLDGPARARIDIAGAVATAGPPNTGTDAGWLTVEVEEGTRHELLLTRAPTARIAGVVRENGVPLAGARVRFLDGPGAAAASSRATQMAELQARVDAFASRGSASSDRTGEDGRYQLREVRAGAHRLSITHGGRAMPTVVPVRLDGGDNTFDVELKTSVVRGVVRDPEGKPVAQARVRVEVARAAAAGDMPGFAAMGGLGFTDSSGVRTDDQGAFELRGVQPATALVVRARAKGFAAAASEPFEVEAGGTRDGVAVELLAAGSVEVRCPAETTFAMVTARWQGEGQVAPVSAALRAGRAVLDGLRPGRWTVDIDALGDTEFEARTVEVTAGRTVELGF